MTKQKILRCKQCNEVLSQDYDWLKTSAPSLSKDIICLSCSNKNRSDKRVARILKEENKTTGRNK
jgi:hypothetical protein